MSIISAAREPCLTIGGRKDDDVVSFTVYLLQSEPIDWEVLKSNAVSKVEVYGNSRTRSSSTTVVDETEERMLQLALAVQSNRGLKEIHFHRCHFEELGHLCVAANVEPPRAQPLSLQFVNCSFELRAAKTLQYMLASNDCALGELSFAECDLEGPAADAIAAGLSKNKSLRSFEFLLEDETQPTLPTPICGVVGMLNVSASLVKLSLTAQTELFWQNFASVTTNKSLESLFFWDSRMEVSYVNAIVLKCFMMPSLKKLGFGDCKFTCHAMNMLMKAVSDHKIIDTLCFYGATMELIEPPLELDCSKLQVRKLCLRGTAVPLPSTKVLDQIANNPFIQCLDLQFGGAHGDEGVEKICNVLILPNRGPSELIIDDANFGADMLTDALQQNNSIRSLVINDMTLELVPFVQGLPNMVGLRKLSIGLGMYNDNMEDLFQELVQSLEQNTTLHTLLITGIGSNHPVAKKYLSRIRYFLAINRVGRNSLMMGEPTVVDGLWANVLAKSSNEVEGINYILTEKPDIVTSSRKRKNCDNY